MCWLSHRPTVPPPLTLLLHTLVSNRHVPLASRWHPSLPFSCVNAAGIATDAFIDFVVGHGELWSAQLLTAALKQQGADVAFMDTRDVLVVTPTSDGTSVDLKEEESDKRLEEWFKTHGNHKIVVATGFIAKNTK